MEVTSVQLAVVTSLGLCIVYLWTRRRRGSVFKDQGVPEVQISGLFGGIKRITSKPLFETDYEDYLKYGPLYGVSELFMSKLFVNDFEIYKQITSKDFHVFPQRFDVTLWDSKIGKNLLFFKGEEWKRGRKVVTPIFATGKLKRMYSLMEKCSNEVLEALLENGSNVDMKDFWGCYTLNVIARCCFATDVNAFKDKQSPFVIQSKRFFSQRLLRMPFLFAAPVWLSKLLRINACPQDTRDFYSDAITYILEQRRKNPKSDYPVDILKLLTEACEEAKKEEATTAKDGELKRKLFDDDFIIAQSILFFLAGYETTATALMFATYILATKPDIQEKLHQELVKIQSPLNGSIEYEDLINCKYLNAFLFETLRLYSPLLRIERLAKEDYVIPQNGIKVPKGAVVAFSPHAFHRNPDNFPDPETFNPERFLSDQEEDLTHRVISFGAGPRSCVAMRFALLEAKLATAKTVLKFKILTTEETMEDIQFLNGFDLIKCEPIILSFEKRIN